jgi:hypothetical protein
MGICKIQNMPGMGELVAETAKLRIVGTDDRPCDISRK